MSQLTALYDASVLYPSLTRNLLQDRPELTPERLTRTRRLMGAAVPDAQVDG